MAETITKEGQGRIFGQDLSEDNVNTLMTNIKSVWVDLHE